MVSFLPIELLFHFPPLTYKGKQLLQNFVCMTQTISFAGYNFVTPGVYNPSGGLPGQKNVMDLLKKFGFFKFLDKFQKGRGSANVGDDKDSSYLVSDIPMWASDYPEIDPYDDSVVQMCISQLLEKEGVDYWTTEGPAFTDDLENCYCNKMKFSGHVSCQSSIGGNKDSSDTSN